MGKYDITNDEQLRILSKRLDEIAADRAVVNDRLDQMTEDGQTIISEWQAWRKSIEQRLGQHTALIAERLRHPLMDPATVEEMRQRQAAIERHLSAQDAALLIAADKVREEMGERLAPVEGLIHNLREAVRLMRWVLVAFGGGFCYEVGKVIVDRWLR